VDPSFPQLDTERGAQSRAGQARPGSNVPSESSPSLLSRVLAMRYVSRYSPPRALRLLVGSTRTGSDSLRSAARGF